MVALDFEVHLDIDELIEMLKEQGWRPVKHGRWMGTVCSACGESFSEYYDCNFCPNCGAYMMDGENDETD